MDTRRMYRIGLLIGLGLVAAVASEAAPKPATPNETAAQQRDTMKIRIQIGNKTLTATLNSSKTAQEFAALLPLSLTLEDFAQAEKISDLPRRLSTEGAPEGSDPSAGDIAYYAPWGNLAIFYRDSRYASGLVILGKIEGSVAALGVSGSLKVRIERVS